jgi:ribosomal-protein-alanine N-acetyltransferase
MAPGQGRLPVALRSVAAPRPSVQAARGSHAARRRGADVVAEGGRVLLRLPRARDRAEFTALFRASRRFLAPWEPRILDPGGNERFDKLLRSRRDPASRRYLLCRREDRAVLGAVSVSNIVRGVGQSATLGVWIGAAHARQGYMREGLRLLVRHAFRDLKLHRVEANFLPANRASRALAKGAGFRREGYSPRYVKIAGRWQDHQRWALLADDPQPRQGRRGVGPRRAHRAPRR